MISEIAPISLHFQNYIQPFGGKHMGTSQNSNIYNSFSLIIFLYRPCTLFFLMKSCLLKFFNLWFFQYCLIFRELMHTKKRQEDTYDHLKEVLGDAISSCEIEMVGPEIAACSQGSSFLPPAITEDKFNSYLDEQQSGSLPSNGVSINMDNSLSPGHTLVQIVCQDHKGLLYDIMRTLKEFNMQVTYFESLMIDWVKVGLKA